MNGEVHGETVTHNNAKRCLHKWILISIAIEAVMLENSVASHENALFTKTMLWLNPLLYYNFLSTNWFILFFFNFFAPADRDDLIERNEVERFQEVILEAIQMELRTNHSNYRMLLPRLLCLLVDLRQLVLDHIKQVQQLMLMDDPSYPGPPPLIREIFGLYWYRPQSLLTNVIREIQCRALLIMDPFLSNLWNFSILLENFWKLIRETVIRALWMLSILTHYVCDLATWHWPLYMDLAMIIVFKPAGKLFKAVLECGWEVPICRTNVKVKFPLVRSVLDSWHRPWKRSVEATFNYNTSRYIVLYFGGLY